MAWGENGRVDPARARTESESVVSRYSAKIGPVRSEVAVSDLMLDPSMLIDARALSVLEGENGLDEIYVSDSFVSALKDPDRSSELWAYFGSPKASRPDDVVDFIDRFGLRRFESSSVNSDFAYRESRRVDLAGSEIVSGVLYEEWLFLTGNSWIGSKSKKSFNALRKAGMVAIDFGRTKLDSALLRTLRQNNVDPPAVLDRRQRLRASMKWVAVGGPPVAGLLEPLVGMLGGVTAGFFLLFDP